MYREGDGVRRGCVCDSVKVPTGDSDDTLVRITQEGDFTEVCMRRGGTAEMLV